MTSCPGPATRDSHQSPPDTQCPCRDRSTLQMLCWQQPPSRYRDFLYCEDQPRCLGPTHQEGSPCSRPPSEASWFDIFIPRSSLRGNALWGLCSVDIGWGCWWGIFLGNFLNFPVCFYFLLLTSSLSWNEVGKKWWALTDSFGRMCIHVKPSPQPQQWVYPSLQISLFLFVTPAFCLATNACLHSW